MAMELMKMTAKTKRMRTKMKVVWEYKVRKTSTNNVVVSILYNPSTGRDWKMKYVDVETDEVTEHTTTIEKIMPLLSIPFRSSR